MDTGAHRNGPGRETFSRAAEGANSVGGSQPRCAQVRRRRQPWPGYGRHNWIKSWMVASTSGCTRAVAPEFQRLHSDELLSPVRHAHHQAVRVLRHGRQKRRRFLPVPLALFGITYPLEKEDSAVWAHFETRHGSDHQMCSGTTSGVVLCDRYGGAREKLRKWIFDQRGDEQGAYGHIHVSRGDVSSVSGRLHQPHEYAYFWSGALPALPVDPIVNDEWLLEEAIQAAR